MSIASAATERGSSNVFAAIRGATITCLLKRPSPAHQSTSLEFRGTLERPRMKSWWLISLNQWNPINGLLFGRHNKIFSRFLCDIHHQLKKVEGERGLTQTPPPKMPRNRRTVVSPPGEERAPLLIINFIVFFFFFSSVEFVSSSWHPENG